MCENYIRLKINACVQLKQSLILEMHYICTADNVQYNKRLVNDAMPVIKVTLNVMNET